MGRHSWTPQLYAGGFCEYVCLGCGIEKAVAEGTKRPSRKGCLKPLPEKRSLSREEFHQMIDRISVSQEESSSLKSRFREELDSLFYYDPNSDD